MYKQSWFFLPVYKHTKNDFFDNFLKISDQHFLKISPKMRLLHVLGVEDTVDVKQ